VDVFGRVDYVSKEESSKITYPSSVRAEGIGPAQYGTKSLLGDKFVDIEEKYDLTAGAEGFGREGNSDNDSEDSEDETFTTNQGNRTRKNINTELLRLDGVILTKPFKLFY
jgi:hypothetical protein